MTHFVDLSRYTYDDTDTIETDNGRTTYRPDYDRLNVGWVDAPHDFAKGPTPPWLPDALLDIIAGPRINSMRGFHQCTFCPEPDPAAYSMIKAEHPNGTLLLGYSEIRIPTGTGTMFAAPSLIWHYVTSHLYRPPDHVIDAIENYDPAWMAEPSPWIPGHADRISFD